LLSAQDARDEQATEKTMKLDSKTTALVAALLLIGRTSAPAAVFTDKSPEQKLRADIGNQITRYTKCLSNVLLACEKHGFQPGAECSLETGTATAPADPKGTFAAQIAKCDARLDFNHKGPKGNSSQQNYELIGCPSFGATDPFADMEGFESGASFLKGVVDDFVSSMPPASGCTDTKSCKAATKVLLDFAAALGKCQTLCENDYKGKHGNGGATDDVARCGLSGDPRAQACLDAAVADFFDKAAAWPLRDFAGVAAVTLADHLNDDLFNAAPNCH
jgi:hypothetical protein